MVRFACLALVLLFASLNLQACNSDSIATSDQAEPVEILVASNPVGATLLMAGTEIGTTPMSVSVRKTTPVNLRLKGYESSQVFLDPKGELIMTVALEPAAKAPTPQVAAPPKSTGPRTIASAKQLYREGKLDKVEYKQQVTRLKYAMKSELDTLKTRYRKGELDKLEYQKKARAIKYRYGG